MPCKDDPQRYSHFSSDATSYVADADKLKMEFANLRTEYTKCRLNFQKSGMGAGADAEKQQEDGPYVYVHVSFHTRATHALRLFKELQRRAACLGCRC